MFLNYRITVIRMIYIKTQNTGAIVNKKLITEVSVQLNNKITK